MVTENERLAQVVKRRMKDKGLEVSDLVSRTGVTEAAIYRSLTGITDWPLRRVFLFADALGTTATDLIAEAESNIAEPYAA